MKKYQILVQGKNFSLSLEGEAKTMGFYTTRWVEAKSPQDAENSVIELIKNDKNLKDAVLNEKNNPPMLYAEEIIEIENFEGVKPPGSGYSFYPEEGIEQQKKA